MNTDPNNLIAFQGELGANGGTELQFEFRQVEVRPAEVEGIDLEL